MTLDQLRACRFYVRHPTAEGFGDMAGVRHFVNAIPDEYIRKMVAAYYLSGLTWREVSAQFYPNSAAGCRMMVTRYLKTLGVE